MPHLRPVLLGLATVVLGGSLVACSSSGGGSQTSSRGGTTSPASTPTSSDSSSSTGAAGATDTPAVGSSGDESAKYSGVLKLLDTGSLAKPTPGVVTRYDASGKVNPSGQFEVSLDSGSTIVCFTDTATNVSVQFKESDRQHLYVYSAPRCTTLLGTVVESSGSGSAKAGSDNATLKGIATQINKLDNG